MSEPVSLLGTLILISIGTAITFYCVKNRFMVSQSLVLVNFGIFAVWWIMLMIRPSIAIDALVQLGFQPIFLTSLDFGILTLVSSIFMHGYPMHLLMNMLILILLGVPFEERIGSSSFLKIYFISGIVGSILTGSISLWNDDQLETINIGASGAVFGVMGAFVLLYPRLEIPMLLGPIFMHRVPVLLSTIVFVAMETLYVALGTVDGIGHGTHMASFIVGVFLAPHYSTKNGEGKKSSDFDASTLHKIFEKTKIGEHELQMIEESDEPELVNAWVETFWEIQKCPNCESKLIDKARCPECKINYLD